MSLLNKICQAFLHFLLDKGTTPILLTSVVARRQQQRNENISAGVIHSKQAGSLSRI
jgi:hypothetical protein